MNKDGVHTTVLLPHKLHRKLKLYCANNKTSMARVIFRLLHNFLLPDNEDPKVNQLQDAARKISGT